MQRAAAKRAKKERELIASTDPLKVVRGTAPGMRRHRKEKGGGNAVRKTMRVFRAAYREEVRNRGFDLARLEKGPKPQPPVFPVESPDVAPEGWVRNPEFDKATGPIISGAYIKDPKSNGILVDFSPKSGDNTPKT